MSVYFVYRTHYNTPSLNHFKRFDDATILEWFQRNWQPVSEEEHAFVKNLLGCHVYGFGSLFANIAEHSLPPPRSTAQLKDLLGEHLYVEGEVLVQNHCVQVLTDDDELEMAFYFFDDDYVAKYPAKAAFLLRSEWKLPEDSVAESDAKGMKAKVLRPKGKGAGSTYMMFLAYSDSGNLSETEGPRIFKGLRLPELVRHLASVISPGDYGWPFELLLLRSQIAVELPMSSEDEIALFRGVQLDPVDGMRWDVYSDWLEERGRPELGVALLADALQHASFYPIGAICNQCSTAEFGVGNRSSARVELDELLRRVGGRAEDLPEPRIQTGQHVAQMSFPVERWDTVLYHRWILFDDLWASANSDLAKAILTYASKWNVLS